MGPRRATRDIPERHLNKPVNLHSAHYPCFVARPATPHVLVSYFEWAQNLQHQPWDLETVRARAEERLTQATRLVADTVAEQKTSLRAAAYEIAIGRVKEALLAAGI